MLYGVARAHCIERLQDLFHHAGFQDDLFDQTGDEGYAGTIFVCSSHDPRYRFVWDNRLLFLFLLKGADLYTLGHADPSARRYHLQVLETLENYRQNPDQTHWRNLAPLPRDPLGFDGTIGETLQRLVGICQSRLLIRHQGRLYPVPPMHNHFLGHPIDARNPPDAGLVTAIVLAHQALLDNESSRIRDERTRFLARALNAGWLNDRPRLFVCPRKGIDGGLS